MVEPNKVYTIDEAIAILKRCPPVKFDQSVEIALRMGVDPRKSDQTIRGTVSLPNGTGKQTVVVAIVKKDRIDEALKAGADHAGHEELIEKIQGGWTSFDAIVATPDMMRDVGKLGKVLGPRGLMPTPKAGTVTTDIAKAIQELKAGKIEFKMDRHGVIANGLGKVSFAADKIRDNVVTYLSAVQRSRPANAKGQFMQKAYLSTTMGPGLKIDLKEFNSVKE